MTINDGTPKDKTLASLGKEIARAREKHPGRSYLYEALCEEVCELLAAALGFKPLAARPSRKDIKREALHVACVALRIYEEGSVPREKFALLHIANKEDMFRNFLRSRGVPD